MTASWIVNKMNNLCDRDWFGYSDVFNKETDKTWITNTEKIRFFGRQNLVAIC